MNKKIIHYIRAPRLLTDHFFRLGLLIVFLFMVFIFSASISAQGIDTPQYFYDGLEFEISSNEITSKEKITFTFISRIVPIRTVINKGSKEVIMAPLLKENMENKESFRLPTPSVRFASQPQQLSIRASQTNVSPSISPSATPTPSPSPIPEPTLTLSTGGLDASKLFSMVNDYRKSKGLPEFQKDDKTCQLAVSRAPEVDVELSLPPEEWHKGLRSRNLSYRNNENIISMRTEQAAFDWWINDTPHRENIESPMTYSCIACFGNSCVQEFTSYQPK